MAVLSDSQIRQAVQRHFGDLGAVIVEFMSEVIRQESGGDSGAVGDNFLSGHQSSSSNARYDYGLAQINSQHGFDPKRLVEDIDYNLAAARRIYDAQGAKAWTTAPKALAVLRSKQGTGGRVDVASERARKLAAELLAGRNAPEDKGGVAVNPHTGSTSYRAAGIDASTLADYIDGALAVGVSEADVRAAIAALPEGASLDYLGSTIRALATKTGVSIASLDDLEAQLGLGSDPAAASSSGSTSGEPPNAFASMKEALTGAAEALTDSLASGSLFSGVAPEEVPIVLAEYTNTLSGLFSAIQDINTLETEGGFTGVDGSFITLEQLNNADPLVQAQARAEFYAFGEKVFGNGNRYLQQLGLEEFVVDPSDAETWVDPAEIRQRAQSTFENSLADLQARIDIESLSVSDAGKRIDRILSGLQESRLRAESVTKSLLEAGKWASPDRKTSFSASDLGGGVSALARQAGIPQGSPLVSYTGIQDIDPAGLLAKYDESILGGETFLPTYPERTIDFSSIPTPPDLGQIPLVPFRATAGANPQNGYGQSVPNVVQPPAEPAGVGAGGDMAGAPPIVSRITGLYDSQEGPL